MGSSVCWKNVPLTLTPPSNAPPFPTKVCKKSPNQFEFFMVKWVELICRAWKKIILSSVFFLCSVKVPNFFSQHEFATKTAQSYYVYISGLLFYTFLMWGMYLYIWFLSTCFCDRSFFLCCMWNKKKLFLRWKLTILKDFFDR